MGQSMVDDEGKMIIDDGLSTFVALSRTLAKYEEWKANGKTVLEKDLAVDSNEATIWSPCLLDALESGVVVDYVEYPDQDRDVRVCWNTHVHDAESNRFSATSLYQKLQVVSQAKKRLNTGDYQLVTKRLLEVMGEGKRSAVARWVRAHQHLPSECITWLRSSGVFVGWAKCSWGNLFFSTFSQNDGWASDFAWLHIAAHARQDPQGRASILRV